MIKIAATTIILSGSIVLGAAPFGQQQRDLSGSVRIDGSSTVAPITTAVAEEFRETAPKVRVTVGISGTGGGFKRFAAGETDISNASRPIKKDEFEASRKNNVEFIELPVAYDGLSIVVNKGNSWVDYLTIDDLKKIFQAGNPARTWADVRPGWPNQQIKIFAPGTDSGTFDYFKEIIAPEKGQAIRSDMSVSEDDNVLVTGVAGDRHAIGFFGYAYYHENVDKLKVVAIDGGKGPVTPSDETIENGTYAPFSRPLFIYVNARAAARPEVKAFVEFYLQNMSDMVKEVGYTRLPKAIVERAKANWKAGKTGTHYMDDNSERKSGSLTQVYGSPAN